MRINKLLKFMSSIIPNSYKVINFLNTCMRVIKFKSTLPNIPVKHELALCACTHSKFEKFVPTLVLFLRAGTCSADSHS